MPDFTVRSDSVNVEEIMGQIRARIREKRGVDYTEEQIRELASVKLERFLDPRKVRSELLQQFREGGISPLPNYSFEDTTLFESRRPWLALVRRMLKPLLQLFINPNRLVQALHMQAGINAHHEQYTNLAYEVLHNLVLETTRLGIEVKNLKMRVESLSSRLDFSERRARALEGVVLYRPGEEPEAEAGADGQEAGRSDTGPSAEGRRKRRRRRGRRGPGMRGPGETTPAEGRADAGGGTESDTPVGAAAGERPAGEDAREEPPRGEDWSSPHATSENDLD
jgi:hypothetical protein